MPVPRSLLLSCTLLSLILIESISAASSSTTFEGLSIPLKRIARSGPLSDEWFNSHKSFLEFKYQASSPALTPKERKRQNSGTSILTNWQVDTSYFATVSVGTPSADYNIVLDTGSSDFWLVSNACLPGCASADLAYYQEGSSSTFQNTNSQPFGLAYFGGFVTGSTASETVKLAGITVQNQAFGVVTQFDQSSGVLPHGVSGLMGMAWDPLSKLGLPFWENSAKGVPTWPQPLFTFALSRQINSTSPAAFAPGGIFTVGFLDAAVYTGDIDYVNLVDQTWWLVPVTEVSIDGSTFKLSGHYAAIDTGTTLIGGPQQEVEQLYATITSSQVQPGVGASSGYYFLPCSAQVNLAFSFGGKTWSIDPVDFLAETETPGVCRGALFAGVFGQPGTLTPTWIIGDAFLKNVYSVFRWNPPSVGFATLSNPAGLASNQTEIVTASVASPSSPLTLSPHSSVFMTQSGIAAHATYSWTKAGSYASPTLDRAFGRWGWIGGLLVTLTLL